MEEQEENGFEFDEVEDSNDFGGDKEFARKFYMYDTGSGEGSKVDSLVYTSTKEK